MKCTGGWGGGSAIGPCPGFNYDTTTNRINYSGFSFDAAGNMLTDASNDSYTWDAEGRMATANFNGSAVTYTYNALGQRVERSGSSVPHGGTLDEYYDAFGGRALIINSSTSVIDFLPAVAGKNYVKYQASATFFMHTNPLGSVGLITSGANSNVQEELFYPWGYPMSQWEPWGALYSEQFASLNERDAESGLDTTPNRTYWWGYSRWLTPDPLAGDITNPQSLNRYAYALNNPLSFIDPTGLEVYCYYNQDTDQIDLSDCVSQSEGAPPDGYLPINVTQSVTVNGSDDSAASAVLITLTLPTFSPSGGGSGESNGGNNEGGTAANNQKPSKTACFLRGAAVGAGGALLVGGLAVGAVALGAPAAAVTGVLLVAGGIGGASTLYSAGSNIANGNYSGAAYDVGSLAGGVAAGGLTGGAVGDSINPPATRGWSLSGDLANRYNPALGSIDSWLGTGPDAPAAAGGTAASGSGLGRFLSFLKGGC